MILGAGCSCLGKGWKKRCVEKLTMEDTWEGPHDVFFVMDGVLTRPPSTLRIDEGVGGWPHI